MRSSLSYLSFLCSIAAQLFSRCNAEPPNPLYQDHMNDATAVYNTTIFLIPCPKDIVQKLAGPYPLLPPPFAMPDGTAPLVLQFGKLVDIRQNAAQIPELMSASISIPFVDRLKNGKSPFSLSKYSFGDQAIPTAVSSLIEGYQNELATFTPAHEAYALSQGVLTYQVRQTIINPPPIPVGGPGISIPTFDALFMLSQSDSPTYTQAVFENFVNGPIFGYGPGCGTITSFFNYTFTMPRPVVGNVTLYGPAGGDNIGIPLHFPKTLSFTGIQGITATVAEIQGTFPPVNCSGLA